MSSTRFRPGADLLGGYAPADGTIAFYTRLRTALAPDHVVLDLGAGRGAWFEDDGCAARIACRDLRGSVGRVIGADVDPAVRGNRAVDEALMIDDGRVPLPDGSVDVVVADYVLEHVTDPARFVGEVDRLLRPGGLFAARTPHLLNYTSLAARLVPNARHRGWLRLAQPERRAEDVFPTAYRLNTAAALRRAFPESRWEHRSHLHVSEPQYHFGSRPIYTAMRALHWVLPAVLTANLFVFVRKRGPS
jgi:SAM-dependent methyltransferase